jgi:hypothetical protein
MLDIWNRAVFRPFVATYEQLLREQQAASLVMATGWIALAGFFAGAIQGLLGGGLLLMLCSAPLIAIVAAIAFVISSAILYIIARALGGEGNLDGQSYLLAAGEAPMLLVSALLGVIHPALSILANLYTLWLNIVALQAAHRYGAAKAALTVLIPAIVVAALFACCFLALAPAIEDVYDELQRSLDLNTADAGSGTLASTIVRGAARALDGTPDAGAASVVGPSTQRLPLGAVHSAGR